MGFVVKLIFFSSFLLAKERAVQRSVDRVSKSARGVNVNALAQMHGVNAWRVVVDETATFI
jgi:hypothetical protein